MGAPETKRERFERLSATWIATATEAIRRIGNFCNTRVYDYCEADVDEIFDRLRS